MPKTKKLKPSVLRWELNITQKNTIPAGYANGTYFSMRREQQELYSGFFENGRCRWHGAVYRFAVKGGTSGSLFAFFVLAGGLGLSVPMIKHIYIYTRVCLIRIWSWGVSHEGDKLLLTWKPLNYESLVASESNHQNLQPFLQQDTVSSPWFSWAVPTVNNALC